MSFLTKKWMVLPAAVVLAGSVAFAQSQPPATDSNSTSTAQKPDPTVHQRKENQQDRIANGIQSGQLNAGETSKLESKEAAVNGEVKADRAANGGKLTQAERQQVNHQQNQLSHQIYNDKHNANTAHYGNNEVGQRRENQQDRIAQGVKSGQLTAGETAKLERQQKSINRQVASDRAANGGKLTNSEKRQVNSRQNRASGNIYNKKHNERTQGGAKHKSK
jgi:hypothetical protein